MAIANNYKNKYIFHFTDIRNLDSIIKNGLLCTNIKNKNGITHRNIANTNIQNRRATMKVPVGPKGKVHDYVPFYFSSINSMLLKKLNEKNVDQPLIIYLCVKIDRLDKDDAVFTDASANTNVPPTFYDDVKDLNKLNWELIDSKKWSVPTDEGKHKKMAEALIYNRVGIEEVDAIVVYNDCAKKKVEKIFKNNGIEAPNILFDFEIKEYRFYYTKFFFNDRNDETLVYGPFLLLKEFQKLISNIKSARKEKTYSYKSIKELVNALDKDFSVLPELKEVMGLQQNYEPHNDTVDAHTKKVAHEMRCLDYYKNASDERKNVLLLAAYLHDMGKGPKSKWSNKPMCRPYLDHPADAIPMLKRILVEEIENLSDEEIRQICMLVVYHDIIGDCIKKGREKQQVIEVIKNEDDLDMLFAISCADVKAIYDPWGLELIKEKKSFKEEIMKMKQA
ncbi:MAG: type II toxin-antitoxin system toxin DNA ADP-ribosyl transferase DarT [Prevotella intermedia]